LRIAEALEKFLVQLQADGRSPHTIGQYQRHIRLLARWAHDVGHGRDKMEKLGHEDVAAFLDGHDAVLSCLGHRRHADAHLLQDGADALLDAMACRGVNRCLFISQGLLFATHNPLAGLLRAMLARHVADSTAMEHLIELSDTDWTIVRPPRLLDGGHPHGYRAAPGTLPDGPASLERADLAAFMLDVVEKHQYPRAIVGVTSA